MGIGELIMLGSSVATLIDFFVRPPRPHCPKCGTPMNDPGTRTSRCVKCHQKISWRFKEKRHG